MLFTSLSSVAVYLRGVGTYCSSLCGVHGDFLNPFRKSSDVYGVYCKCLLQVSIASVYCKCLLRPLQVSTVSVYCVYWAQKRCIKGIITCSPTSVEKALALFSFRSKILLVGRLYCVLSKTTQKWSKRCGFAQQVAFCWKSSCETAKLTTCKEKTCFLHVFVFCKTLMI